LLLSVAVHPTNIQDRDGVALVLDRRTRRLFPFIERIYGDGGYQRPKAAKAAAKTGYWTIESVERRGAATVIMAATGTASYGYGLCSGTRLRLCAWPRLRPWLWRLSDVARCHARRWRCWVVGLLGLNPMGEPS
jgi:hypothetical protein